MNWNHFYPLPSKFASIINSLKWDERYMIDKSMKKDQKNEVNLHLIKEKIHRSKFWIIIKALKIVWSIIIMFFYIVKIDILKMKKEKKLYWETYLVTFVWFSFVKFFSNWFKKFLKKEWTIKNTFRWNGRIGN